MVLSCGAMDQDVQRWHRERFLDRLYINFENALEETFQVRSPLILVALILESPLASEVSDAVRIPLRIVMLLWFSHIREPLG